MKDISFIPAVVGIWIGFFFGPLDGLLSALLVMVVADYFTGLTCAIVKSCLSSKVGYKGILKKICIFAIVGVANIVDTTFIGTGSSFRTGIILFYLANEGISILENLDSIGVPLPTQLINVLQSFKKINDKKEDKQ